MKAIKNMLDLFERKVLIGNSKFQRLFESLHRFSLRGMNYDQVQSLERSGELFVMNYLKEKLRSQKKPILFDIGANTGEYSKALATIFDECTIYSMEALPSTYEMLKQNLNTYKNITCVNTALGARKEEREFYSDGAGSHLSTFFPVGSLNNQRLEKTVTSISTIDSFCTERKIERIDFLKIDVEGFELEVLTGAEKMIKGGKISNIQFEFGSNHIHSGAHFYHIFQILSDYKISRVLKNGLRHYVDYNKIQEIYLSANYLAERKDQETKI